MTFPRLCRRSLWLPGFLCLVNGLNAAPLRAAAQTPAAPKIVADRSQLKTLDHFARDAEKLARRWYPRIVKTLDAKNAPLHPSITILMDADYNGVAATEGATIHVSMRYVLKHPEDKGMIVHELTHVVQAYPQYDPVWLVEGIADYVRFYQFEPASRRPHPDPAKANCRDSYRTTAAFLDWASHRYDPDLIKKLDAALKSSTYSEGMFQQATGKNLDDLNTEWLASLKAPALLK